MPVHPSWVLAASTSNNSGGGSGLFLVLLIVAVMIFLFTRSQRGARRRAQAAQSSIVEGSRVITSAGIYATVVGVDDVSYQLEIDDDVIIRVVKAAVTRLAPDEPAEDDAEDSTATGDLSDDDAGSPVTLAKADPADSARSSSEA